MREEDLDRLRRVGVFSVLDAGQLERLYDAARVTEHASGEALTQEGAIGYRFHLIVEGAASVERGGRDLARLGPGDFVGEISLLGGGHATATVRVTEPTRSVTLQREAFWEVLQAEPQIALRILEVVARRLERELEHGDRLDVSESAGG
jgi:CRP/FNR family transcriptional regulator, cyclic AMP receptor protein